MRWHLVSLLLLSMCRYSGPNKLSLSDFCFYKDEDNYYLSFRISPGSDYISLYLNETLLDIESGSYLELALEDFNDSIENNFKVVINSKNKISEIHFKYLPINEKINLGDINYFSLNNLIEDTYDLISFKELQYLTLNNYEKEIKNYQCGFLDLDSSIEYLDNEIENLEIICTYYSSSYEIIYDSLRLNEDLLIEDYYELDVITNSLKESERINKLRLPINKDYEDNLIYLYLEIKNIFSTSIDLYFEHYIDLTENFYSLYERSIKRIESFESQFNYHYKL